MKFNRRGLPEPTLFKGGVPEWEAVLDAVTYWVYEYCDPDTNLCYDYMVRWFNAGVDSTDDYWELHEAFERWRELYPFIKVDLAELVKKYSLLAGHLCDLHESLTDQTFNQAIEDLIRSMSVELVEAMEAGLNKVTQKETVE